MANAAFGTPKRTTAMTPKRRMESAQLAEKRGLYWLSLADVAQLVEHFTRNEGVRGSNPRVGSFRQAGWSASVVPAMAEFVGTVTFLFTDIEGSTRLVHKLRDGYGESCARSQSA